MTPSIVRDVVPDYMSALVGWRAWSLRSEGELCSLNDGLLWTPGSKSIATCTAIAQRLARLSHGPYMTTSVVIPVAQAIADTFADWWQGKADERTLAEHMPPAKDCTCGFYARKTQDGTFTTYARGQQVWGEVYLWGKVQDHDGGYRAEFAYPKSLSTSAGPELAAKVAQRYGVPCVHSEVARQNRKPSGVHSSSFIFPSTSVSLTNYLSSGDWSTVGWQASEEADSTSGPVVFQPNIGRWKRLISRLTE